MTANHANYVSYTRQTDILDPGVAADTRITVCGCGTVGSNAAMQLAKAGFGHIDLYDMDDVEAHNIPSQDFTISDIGKKKSVALAARLGEISSHIKARPIIMPLVGGEIFGSNIAILAVDSMELRKQLFLHSAMASPAVRYALDFRMGGNFMRVWAVDTLDRSACERYEESLHGSADAAPAPCGGRTFAPVGALAGSIATQLVTRIVRGDTVPFYLHVDMDSFTVVTAGFGVE